MQIKPLLDTSKLPLLIRAENDNEKSLSFLCDYLRAEQESLSNLLYEHAAILFRGFDCINESDFSSAITAFDFELIDYTGGNSPRTRLGDQVYTSTEYPQQLEISLHNEMSYTKVFPKRLLFFCEHAAETGGETTLASSTAILNCISEQLIELLSAQEILYTQNLHPGWGIGRSWQQVFETEDKSIVEKYCKNNNMTYNWSDEGLATHSKQAALAIHPITKEEVWFNQAEQWHISNWDGTRQNKLIEHYGEQYLPKNAYFGNGQPLSIEILDEIRDCYRRNEIIFPWQNGDLLLIDNMLCMHGRKSFTGNRRVLVSMT